MTRRMIVNRAENLPCEVKDLRPWPRTMRLTPGDGDDR
jgi:hypothetical protein